MSLKDELQEVDGIGPAKAEEIMGLLGNTDPDGISESDVRKALRFADKGNARACADTLRSALE